MASNAELYAYLLLILNFFLKKPTLVSKKPLSSTPLGPLARARYHSPFEVVFPSQKSEAAICNDTLEGSVKISAPHRFKDPPLNPE